VYISNNVIQHKQRESIQHIRDEWVGMTMQTVAIGMVQQIDDAIAPIPSDPIDEGDREEEEEEEEEGRKGRTHS